MPESFLIEVDTWLFQLEVGIRFFTREQLTSPRDADFHPQIYLFFAIMLPFQSRERPAMSSKQPLLEVKGLKTCFFTEDGIVHAVNGDSIALKEGETLDMTGESGCGRNVAMPSVLGLIPDSPGKVTVGKALF